MLIEMEHFVSVIEAARAHVEPSGTTPPRRQSPGDRVIRCPACDHALLSHFYGGPGNLVIDTQAGTLTHRAPVIYQDVQGVRQPVEGGYAILPDSRVVFKVGSYDREFPLVIDPVLSYATYLGGSLEERIDRTSVV